MFWQQNNFITGQIYCNEEVNILEICFKWNHLKGVQGNVSVLFNKGKHFDGNVSNMGKYFELRLEAGANRNLAELSIWHIWIIYTTRGGGDHYWLYPTWHSTSSDLPGKQCYQNIDKSFILVFKVKKNLKKMQTLPIFHKTQDHIQCQCQSCKMTNNLQKKSKNRLSSPQGLRPTRPKVLASFAQMFRLKLTHFSTVSHFYMNMSTGSAIFSNKSKSFDFWRQSRNLLHYSWKWIDLYQAQWHQRFAYLSPPSSPSPPSPPS